MILERHSEYAESRGYGVMRDLVGHGVGPTMQGNHGSQLWCSECGLRLRRYGFNEPMINTGDWEIDTDDETGMGSQNYRWWTIMSVRASVYY